MKISIIGISDIGAQLGLTWAECGHEVVFGVRDASSHKVPSLLKRTTRNVHIMNASEAAVKGEVVLFSLPFEVLEEIAESTGCLQGRIIIDATNPFDAPLFGSASGAEALSIWLDSPRVVKAFNTLDIKSYLSGRMRDICICGDREQDKAVVSRLAADAGLTAVDTGPLSKAHLLESIPRLDSSLPQSQSSEKNLSLKYSDQV